MNLWRGDKSHSIMALLERRIEFTVIVAECLRLTVAVAECLGLTVMVAECLGLTVAVAECLKWLLNAIKALNNI